MRQFRLAVAKEQNQKLKTRIEARDMESFLQLALAPYQYEFMVKATLVSALIGVVCAILSCFVILKGWSLMGDAVSHSVLPGVVLAYILNIPFAVGAFVFGLGSVVAIGFIKSRTRIKEDTVIGVVFTTLFALGIVLMSRVSSSVHLSHILFGDILGISDGDIIQTIIIGGFALVSVLVLRRDLLLFCFDPTHARSIGLNTTFLYYALLTVLALTIVAALQAVGIILVVAMLVTPGATAYLLSDKFDRMMWIAVLSSVLSCVLGTYASYFIDGATGGCIVVLQGLFFIAAFIFAPKHGMLAKGRERQRQQLEDTLETAKFTSETQAGTG
jgi:manganese transport system permease protein